MRIEHGFDSSCRAEVAELFWSAFSGKIGRLLGPSERGQAFIAKVLQPHFAISAFDGDDLLGVAGFKTSQGGLVGGTLSDLAAVYGWVGGMWRGVLLDRLERDLVDGQLLMDGIFVAKQARGCGVGTALLNAVLSHARELECREVRLDVVDTNVRARALYERHGYVPQGTVKTGLLGPVVGFRQAITMVHHL